jgi:hypothetical protein
MEQSHGIHGEINAYLGYILAISEIKLAWVNLVFRNFSILIETYVSIAIR